MVVVVCGGAGGVGGCQALALKLQCKDFTGKTTNCWDVIDVIQIHAYDRQAKNVHAKIAEYYKVFQDDFEGTNGRRAKTLWLTEVAMGSSKVTDVTGFVTDLMDPKTGLTNRAAGSAGGFGYVERVSWFSEFNFPAFNVSGNSCFLFFFFQFFQLFWWGRKLSRKRFSHGSQPWCPAPTAESRAAWCGHTVSAG